MKTSIFKADKRGSANHGWLKARYSFSFANYYDAEKMHFGMLRVLNDDIIEPGMGFGIHPHDNMEIITIPLSGDLEHKDSTGNTSVIHKGEIQVMSAGRGIFHSEFNANKTKKLNLFQIWVLPNKKNVKPRYAQMYIEKLEKRDAFYQVISPNADGGGLWIYQDAWFHMGNLSNGFSGNYKLMDSKNGTYLIVINGAVEVAGVTLKMRDAIGITDISDIQIKSYTDSHILIIEVPMN